MPRWDVLVVGAGFAGAVLARRCADAGRSVLVIERREHLAGNACDERDAHGLLVHRYGPHIFHTNSERVVAWLSRFTAWRPYEHRVRAVREGRQFPIPINRTTLERFFGVELADDAAAEALLARVREPRASVRTSEDVALAGVGRALFEAFIAGYTRKQWGRPASALDASVVARIPVRTDRDDRYFTDRHQAMPAAGYHALFAAMLDHPGIRVELGTAWDAARHRALARHLVWTGPLDAFFDRRFGPLPYRSLRFAHEHVPDVGLIQEVGTLNHPDPAVPFTRITEFKHLTGDTAPGSSLVREFPQDEGEPYYPVPAPESKTLAARYAALADGESDVTFLGRLAQYRYYNMDQVVAAALVRADQLLGTP